MKISIIKRMLLTAILSLTACIAGCITIAFADDSNSVPASVQEETVDVGATIEYQTVAGFTTEGGLRGYVESETYFFSLNRKFYVNVHIMSYEDLKVMRKIINNEDNRILNCLGGTGWAETEYEREDLKMLLRTISINDIDIRFILQADITIPDYWEPIGKPGSDDKYNFQSTFDGNGYTITMQNYGVSVWGNSVANQGDYTRYGLFCKTKNATIKNLYLKIDEIDIYNTSKTESFYGGLVGNAQDTTISHCYVEFTSHICVVSREKVWFGGIAGKATGSDIKNCAVEFTPSTGFALLNTNNAMFIDDNFMLFGGIVGNDCSSVKSSIVNFNNLQLAMVGVGRNDNNYNKEIYSVGKGIKTTTTVIYKDFHTEFRDYKGSYINAENHDYYGMYGNPSTWPSGGSEEETKTSGSAYTGTWSAILSDRNSIGDSREDILNAWYMAQKNNPIQGWFAKFDIKVHNVWGGNTSQHPNESVSKKQYKLTEVYWWKNFYNIINNNDNCLTSSRGYTFRGFSTESNLTKEIGDGGYYQIYREGKEGYQDCYGIESGGIVDLGNYDSAQGCYHVYAMWELLPYTITFKTSGLISNAGASTEWQKEFNGFGNTGNGYKDSDWVYALTIAGLKEEIRKEFSSLPAFDVSTAIISGCGKNDEYDANELYYKSDSNNGEYEVVLDIEEPTGKPLLTIQINSNECATKEIQILDNDDGWSITPTNCAEQSYIKDSNGLISLNSLSKLFTDKNVVGFTLARGNCDIYSALVNDFEDLIEIKKDNTTVFDFRAGWYQTDDNKLYSDIIIFYNIHYKASDFNPTIILTPIFAENKVTVHYNYGENEYGLSDYTEVLDVTSQPQEIDNGYTAETEDNPIVGWVIDEDRQDAEITSVAKDSWTVTSGRGVVDIGLISKNYIATRVNQGSWGDLYLKPVWKKKLIVKNIDPDNSNSSEERYYITRFTGIGNNEYSINYSIGGIEVEGYDFLGWKVNKTDGNNVTNPTPYDTNSIVKLGDKSFNTNELGYVALIKYKKDEPDVDIEIEAMWDEDVYTITYDAGGGTLNTGGAQPAVVDGSQTYTFKDEITLASATRSGHQFTGWSVTGSNLSNWASTISADALSIGSGHAGNVTLTAMWDKTLVTVKYLMGYDDEAYIPGLESVDGVFVQKINNYADINNIDLPTPQSDIEFVGWQVSRITVGGASEKDCQLSDGSVIIDGKTIKFGDIITYKGTTTVKKLISCDTSCEIELTAIWETYTITYVTAGGSLPEGYDNPQMYTFSDTITLPTPSRQYYTFDGWKYQATSSDESNGIVKWESKTYFGSIGSGYKGDVTLTAQWAPNIVTVTFDANDGGRFTSCPSGFEELDDQHITTTINQGSSIGGSVLNNVGRALKSTNGKLFGGWYTNSACTKKYSGDSILYSATLYAKWVLIELKIYTNPDEDDLFNFEQISLNNAGGNYEISIHSTDDDDNNGVIDDRDIADCLILGFSQSGLNIKDRCLNPINPDIYNDYPNHKAVFHKDGYNGPELDGSETLPDNGMSLYITWEKVIYSLLLQTEKGGREELSWYKNGKYINNNLAELGLELKYNFSKTIATLTIKDIEFGAPIDIEPRRDGYRFEGWYLNKELTGYPITTIPTRGDGTFGTVIYYDNQLTLFAKWIKVFKIQYQLEDETIINGLEPREGIPGENITLPEYIYRGYKVTKWQHVCNMHGATYPEYNVGQRVDIDNVDCKDTIVFRESAKASVYYTITYEVGDGELVGGAKPQQRYYMSNEITLASAQAKNPGEYFHSWRVTSAEGDVLTNNWKVDDTYNGNQGIPSGKYGNVTLTAIYLKNNYTIRYITDGGDIDTTNCIPVVSSQEHKYFIGDEIVLASATKQGYKFMGWKVSSVEVAAGWKQVDEMYEADNLSIGNENGGCQYWGNVDLTAIWSPINGDVIIDDKNSYQITLDANGGSFAFDSRWFNIMDASNTNIIQIYTFVVEGGTISLPEPKHSSGEYEFAGWYHNKECVGDAVNSSYTMPSAAITLYAKWQKSDS